MPNAHTTIKMKNKKKTTTALVPSVVYQYIFLEHFVHARRKGRQTAVLVVLVEGQHR